MIVTRKTLCRMSVWILTVLAGAAAGAAPQALGHPAPTNLDFEGELGAADLPSGWVRWGKPGSGYSLAAVTRVAHGGQRSVWIAGPDDPGDAFGGLGQAFPAEPYRGKRVRFSGYLRTSRVTGGGAGLCLRINGPEKRVLAFDNMRDRRVLGTTEWTRHEIVLDVPEQATAGALGALLAGSGSVWVDDLELEVVDAGTATTESVARGHAAVNLDFEDGTGSGDLPRHWDDQHVAPPTGGDGYQVRVDTRRKHGGEASGRIEWKASGKPSPQQFGTLTQMMLPDAYRGKRLRLSGHVRANRVANGYAGLWMRVDGPRGGAHLAFDNMKDRGLTGTRRWRSCEIVLDVAQEATAIAFGALLTGTGRMWVDDLKLEVVDDSVPTTEQALAGEEFPIDPEILDDYVGTFRVAVQGAGVLFEFRRKGDKLLVVQQGAPEFRIYPESETTFFYKVVDAKFTFVRNNQGEVDRVTLHQFGQEFPGRRVD